MAVRDEIKEQRKKLKGQGFKAHLEYFWEYYKIHTAVALVAIIFIVTLARDIANNKPYALYALFINNQGSTTQEYLQEGYVSYAGIDTNAEAVLVDTSSNFLSSSMDTTVVATSEKIMALLSAKELDVMVGDEQVIYHYGAQETLTDLRNVLSADKLKELEDAGLLMYVEQGYMDYLASEEYSNYLASKKYDENNKYAVMAAYYDENFEEKIPDKSEMDNPVPIAINMSGSAALTECGAYNNNVPYAAVVINSQRPDRALEFLEYLMK